MNSIRWYSRIGYLVVMLAIVAMGIVAVPAPEPVGAAPPVTTFSDDFEGTWDWTVTDSSAGGFGSDWGQSTNRSNSTSHSAYCAEVDGLAGPTYNASTDTIMYHDVDLSGYVAGVLDLQYWLETQSAADFLHIGYYIGTTWYWPWSSSIDTTGFELLSDNIANPNGFLIPNTATRIGFLFSADDTTQYEGAYIDDVVLTEFQPTEVWVDDDWAGYTYWTSLCEVDGNWYQYGILAFSSIQDAIDAVAGSTINVLPGTYTEDLNINKPDLLIRSIGDGVTPGGKDTTTIQGVDGYVITLGGNADNLTLGGTEGEGFTVIGNAADSTVLLQTINGPAGVTLSYNTFDTTGETNMAVAIGSQGVADLTISHNTFKLYKDASGQITGIYFDTGDVTNMLIDSNIFDRYTGTPKWLQWVGNAHVNGIMISNNTVNGANVAIRMFSRTNLFENVTFTSNNINGGYITIGNGNNNSGDDVIKSLSIFGNNFTGPAWEEVFRWWCGRCRYRLGYSICKL